MNQDILNFIAAYRGMLDLYKPKVAPDSVKLKETEELLQTMTTGGNGCGDIGEFMTRITEQDLVTRMTALLSDLAMESLKTQQVGGEPKMPAVADAARGYHAAYEAITGKEHCPETCRVYERVFALEKEAANAGAFVRMLAEEGLYVKMTAVPIAEKLRPLIAQADGISQPVMAYHHERMLALAEQAASALEIDYESNRLLELNQMELMCDTLLMGDLFHTIGNAVSGYLLSPTENNRQDVENAYRFVSEFFGIDDAELFSIPRVVDYIDKVILPMLNQDAGGKPVTRTGFIAEQRGVIQRCLQGRPPVIKGPASRRCAVLWGKKIPLEETLSAFRNPARPE
jgi:hypothetical protein